MKKVIGFFFSAEVMFCSVMMLIDMWRKSSINSVADVLCGVGMSLFVVLANVVLAAMIYVVSDHDK